MKFFQRFRFGTLNFNISVEFIPSIHTIIHLSYLHQRNHCCGTPFYNPTWISSFRDAHLPTLFHDCCNPIPSPPITPIHLPTPTNEISLNIHRSYLHYPSSSPTLTIFILHRLNYLNNLRTSLGGLSTLNSKQLSKTESNGVPKKCCVCLCDMFWLWALCSMFSM